MNKKYLHVSLIFCAKVLFLGCGQNKTLKELAVEKQPTIVKVDKAFLKQYYGINLPEQSDLQLEGQRKDMLEATSRWFNNGLIDTTDILDFVLPQMVNNSVDTGWRLHVRKRMKGIKLPEGKITEKSFLKFCNLVNDSVKGQITFANADEDESLLTYSALNAKGRGSCVAMSDYTNYTFRGLGIPVTTDFIPVWGNLNAPGHAWNRLLLKGKSLPFMGAESNIGDYNPLVLSIYADGSISTRRLPAKVYRHSPYDGLSMDFFGKKVLDVTDEYVDINSIIIEHNEKLSSPVYLATFNRGSFIIVAKGTSSGDKIVFQKMGTDLVYFPVRLDRAKAVPVGTPVICRQGANKTMTPDFDSQINIRIDHLLPLAQGQMYYLAKNGYANLDKIDFHNKYDVCPIPQNKTDYELWYWDMGWKKLSTIKAEGKQLVFQNVPGNALYVVKTPAESFAKTRPFTIEKGSILWL
ncbi:hypothetical protein [Sphingobacterium detergens]|uniref:Transglutaminase superfamily protein n=1 Tax=Sphingobacterium detergens TaxID=1145106 RepID=A0A420B6Q0_SPHD1|nr:hypothetical protein [Sphingobacterium detergens]RKE52466.1 hypothetical protein DFQ12_2703 [Sphingobacterium detergens]